MLYPPKIFFSLFVDDDMVRDMVTYTNQRIDVRAPKYANDNIQSVSHTCPEEIMALMGILIQPGAKHDNKLITEMFDPQHGAPLYRAGACEKKIQIPLGILSV
uniref:PiggyBac transposable element-derived protein domain-containing protein n=1 Tax=Scylla olivacea TaxID=85551 RepID=A0A0P4WGN8_SCYOL